MAGSLVLVDSATVSSAVSTVTLGGADWDDSYNVYVVRFQNVTTDTDTQGLLFKLLDTSNNILSTSNYHVSFKVYRGNTTPENAYGGAAFFYGIDNYLGTTAGEVANGTYYLFNANNSSEYTTMTFENVYVNNSATIRSMNGGGAYKVAAATKGVQFYMNSGNISAGTFKLYGLKK